MKLWMKRPLYSKKELDEQRRKIFGGAVTFSVVVPLYNTPDGFLKEMIDSVIAQTYGGWELCLADGSDDEHASVGDICQRYARQDTRIKYRKLEKNLGIAGNSNAAIAMGEGAYIALLDHDDVLHPAALYEMMAVIERSGADVIYTDEVIFTSPDLRDIFRIHYKPDFAPDNLRANNYICHFTAFKRALLEKTGGFRSGYDGSQDHDLVLRLTAVSERVEHIPKILYYWRAHPASTALTIDAKDYAQKAGAKAVTDSLRAQGYDACAVTTERRGIYRVRYEIKGKPLISIIIPNCDHIGELDTCLRAIEEKTTYKNYEIVIVENNSRDPRTGEYYEKAVRTWDNIRIIDRPGPFNYSAINNFAVREAARGEYILLLNNDTEVISPGWLEEMLMYAQRRDVGAVGAMLYFPDDTVQHAGVILGLDGVAGHPYVHMKRGSYGYKGRLNYAQNYSAVTGACLMMRRDVWEEVGGLDETFAVSYNDVDLCMRIRKAGYLIVWTPHAELYHKESATRGYASTETEKRRRQGEIVRFKERWGQELAAGDPYYNPNLSLMRSDFSLDWEYLKKGRKDSEI